MINPAFSYIKLHQNGKRPVDEWKGDPRRLLSDVREWVAQGYNIGVRCDRQSGCWVLDVDVDVKTGEVSPEWDELLRRHGSLPATYTVKTPSGGLHYYFRFPDGIDVRNDQGKIIAKGVDLRGIGGYVVAAGMRAIYSKHGVDFDGTYDVVDDSPIAQTPDWIADLFREREEKAAEKAERVNAGVVQPKVDNIDPEWDRLARDELNDLFTKTSQLTRLPEGESLEILGEQRGWERGAGFFTLACKIIEVARWPHTAITVEQAHEVWKTRVPPKYAQHDWNNALENAAETWAWGEQQRNPIDLFAGVPTVGNPSAPTGATDEDGTWEPLDISEKRIGWAVPLLFKPRKDDDADDPSGGFQVEKARQIINRIGPIAIDPSGSLWTYDRGVYVNDDKVVLDRLYHMLGDRFSAGHLTNAKYAVQAQAPLLDLTRPPNPGVMNFANGTLEWRETDQVQPHTPTVLETTQFPYEWDAEADCPKFDQWLATMLEPDQITLAWKILGYMMMSGNPLQIAVMLYGDGSNGKGTFLRLIQRLIGMSNISAVPLKAFNERFQTTAMIGKIANIVGDIDSGYEMSTAAFKQVTGADAMQFERKGRDSFLATLWATAVFSANEIPGTNDGSQGYAERWIPLHFKRKASEHRIEGFAEEHLWEEIQGVAAKAVQTLRDLPLHHGADRNKAFDLTSVSALEAVEEFREASNSYYAWIKNHTVISETDVMKPKELWGAFRTATGTRHGGTSCPRKFRAVLDEVYGEAKMRRGMYLGVQRNVRGYAVAVVDDDDTSASDADFFEGISR